MPNLFFGAVSVTLAMLRQTAWPAPAPPRPDGASALTFPTLCLLCGFGLCNRSWGKKKKKSSFLNSLSTFPNQALNPSFLWFELQHESRTLLSSSVVFYPSLPAAAAAAISSRAV